MKRTEAIEWLKNIKEKYIHGGDDFYDYQRRTAIDYAMSVLENIEQKPKTNADRIRAMSDEELAEFIRDVSYECQDAHWGSKCQSCDFPWCSSDQTLPWLQQPAEGE